MPGSRRTPARRPWTSIAMLALAVVGCQPAVEEIPEDAVAHWRGGFVSVDDIERRLGGGRTAETDTADGDQDWVARYRTVAEQIAVDRLMLAEIGDTPAIDAALEDLPDAAARRRSAVLETYLEVHRPEGADAVLQRDIDAYYEENRDRFERPAQRFVFHIFRRTAPGQSQEDTLAELAALRARAEAGEVFGMLAREHSHSETRHLDGRLGWIGRDRLPPKLEEIVFALPVGGTSEPLPAGDGGILVHVSQVIEERQYALDDVRSLIAQRLMEEKRRAWVGEQVAEVPLPDNAIVVAPEDLSETLASPPDAVAASVGDRIWTVAEVRRLIAEDDVAVQPFLDPVAHAESRYRLLVNEQRLILHAEASGFVDDPTHGAAIEARVRADGHQRLIEQRLRARMSAGVDADSADLERFFGDNRHLYQSPLRLAVKTLSLPVGPSAAEDLRTLEALREDLVAGRSSFEEAAVRLEGARVDDLGWLDAARLEGMEPKVRFYLLQLGGPGFAVPYQLSNRLVLPWIVTWEDPEELPYEEVAARVRNDYVDRFAQRLYREVVDERLADVGYHFDETRVEQILRLATD